MATSESDSTQAVRCPCGSEATIRDGDLVDEPGEVWCGCLTCDTGVSAFPRGSLADVRGTAVRMWNTLIRQHVGDN